MRRQAILPLVLALILTAGPSRVLAQDGKVVLKSRAPFSRVAAALERMIADQNMGLVCHTDPQQGADPDPPRREP